MRTMMSATTRSLSHRVMRLLLAPVPVLPVAPLVLTQWHRPRTRWVKALSHSHQLRAATLPAQRMP